MKNKTCLLFIGILLSVSIFAQNVNNIQMPELLNESVRKTINIPNILGYQTLKCDFHTHTVFSDGVVWPTVRIDEAWQEGLDAIAITDHIEGNPSKDQIEGDHNSSYEIALPRAIQKNIILIHAGEITRDMPPGHFNALFLKDTNPLDTPDYMEAFKAASEQGAYIIWNHPGWKSQQPDTCKWWDIHTELYEKGWLNGIEVFNEKEWYPIALDWCVEKDLAITAASDIHGITAGMYNLQKYHRPMTLVLAKKRTEESIREALFDNRTVAWFGNNLAGKEEYLKAIFETAVDIRFYNETRRGKVYIANNNSDVPFHLISDAGQKFNIPANGETMITLKENNRNFEVNNLFVKGTKNLKISLNLSE
ncbi:MAG: hypothetical protein HN778_11570 [Prolixibacteraceae bacterium]|jgi:3',5'-nucleoside bisphosphate phosphatase|nr:hypothetical protein [Prolixibacteraceae bacterium]MBT6763766.1 hypothetical protein [Prolixibacteraceae bacterium]MBT6996864.1 hypothetical protein [Prolixibacteraceae bacterium]MBT7395463.1 hypothetical protein [Prolixibacteraceae bacterium]